MRNLVIVESPNKIKSLKKYLGEDYEIVPSMGHIAYLPTTGKHGFGVDLETWEPNLKIEPDKRKIIKEIKKKTAKTDVVYLATDPDREGEAIAKHLVQFLKIKNYKRIRFNEITKEAVLSSLDNPGDIDENMVNSQKTRRILDRIIGFKLSTLMQRKIQGAPEVPSAGRVQSIALKLIAKREEKIKYFVPVRYATIQAQIKKDVVADFYYPHKKENATWIEPKNLKDIKEKLDNFLIVKDVKIKTQKGRKITPLKQATLYKKASTIGLGAKTTQIASQRLYEGFGEGGLISYHRTDSTRISESFLKKAREYIKEKFGKKYVAEKILGSKGVQDAHEAIRPTDLNLLPDEAKEKFDLSSAEYKIYKLIYIHTLSALMNVPINEMTRYEFENQNYNFYLSYTKTIFDGYYIVTGKKQNTYNINFSIGDKVDVEKYDFKHHKSKPPARYNDGALIEELDSIGVGRPSTFATTIDTLKKRKYVKVKNKAMIPTEFGEIVINKLLVAFPKIINEKYTAQMELDLDKVATGKVNFKIILNDFWRQFEEELQSATSEMNVEKAFVKETGENCPKCGSPLVYRKSKKYKTEFIGCSAFPKCDYIVKKEPPKMAEGNCPECGSPLVYRWSDKYKTEFIGCSAFPKCRYIAGREQPKKAEGNCPECGSPLVYKWSIRYNKEFIGCSAYPKCDYIVGRKYPKKSSKKASKQKSKKSSKRTSNTTRKKAPNIVVKESPVIIEKKPPIIVEKEEPVIVKKESVKLPKMVGRDCPECGGPLIYKKSDKDKSEYIQCFDFPKCKYIEVPSKK